MRDMGPWFAEITGPVIGLWRYEIKLKQRHLIHPSRVTLEQAALWITFEELGIHVAWTRRGARRKVRRLVARRNRRDLIEASPVVVNA